MKGIVFRGDRELELLEFPEPVAGPGEVVIRMRASGMCGSDLHVYRGAPTATGDPLIQGHEPCGEVYSVGPGVTPAMASVGDRVMIHHYWGCNMCEQCRSGWPQLCTQTPIRTLSGNEHGGHAPFMSVPVSTITPLHPDLSFKAGAAIGCGTGTAWGALKRLGGVEGETLVVFGQGPVGVSATMFGAALGARVIAVDIDDSRLEQAKKFGATEVVNSRNVDAVEAILALTDSRGPSRVIETSGATQAAQTALKVLGNWGKVCFVGLGAHVEFDTADAFRRQITLMTSWTLSIVEQKRCADFVVERGLPVDELFTHSFTLDDAAQAYEWFDKQSDGKGVFEF